MDLAQNDPTELQNQIVNMTKEFTRFNKENNQIEIFEYLGKLNASFKFFSNKLKILVFICDKYLFKLIYAYNFISSRRMWQYGQLRY